MTILFFQYHIFLHLLNYFSTFYFVLQYSWLTKNAVIISGEKWRVSAIHIHVSNLPQTTLPSRLPHNTKQSSMYYIGGPCWLSILTIAMCSCPSQTLPFSHSFPWQPQGHYWTIPNWSVCVDSESAMDTFDWLFMVTYKLANWFQDLLKPWLELYEFPTYSLLPLLSQVSLFASWWW